MWVTGSTCKPRTLAPTTPTEAYTVTEKVCDSRGNILYDYLKIGDKDWILENAKPNNVTTFNWVNAQTACPDSSADGTGTRGWRLATENDWNNLLTAVGKGSAGTLLRATSGWTTNSTHATYSKFAAIPAIATGISPAPTGNYAYWWTSGEGGYKVDGQGQMTSDPLDPLNYNLGHYEYMLEQSAAVNVGTSAKLTTMLSVRCVRDPLVCTPAIEQNATCTFNNGTPLISFAAQGTQDDCKDLAIYTPETDTDGGDQTCVFNSTTTLSASDGIAANDGGTSCKNKAVWTAYQPEVTCP